MVNQKLLLILSAIVFLSFVPLRGAHSAEMAPSFPVRQFPVDEQVDPCKNFYEYTCNKVIQSFKLPETRSRHSFSFNDISEFLLESKKNYFKKLQGSETKSDREKMIKTFYVACMNAEAGKADEQKYVAELVEKLNALKTREDFNKFHYENFKSGKPAFISYWANLPNFDNSERMDAYFEIDSLSLPEKSYYEKPEVSKELKELMVSLFRQIKIDNPEEKASWVYEYEFKIAKASLPRADAVSRAFQRTQLSGKFMNQTLNLRLKEFVKGLPGKPLVRDIYGEKVLSQVERSLAQMPLEQLKAVYLYHALSPHLDDAFPQFRELAVAFKSKNFGGPSKRPDRQERCTTEIEEKFGMELDSILLPQVFPQIPREKITSMVEKIRNGLVSSIDQNKWLSPPVKKAALLKLKNLNIRLISPTEEQEWNFNKAGEYSAANPVANRVLYRQLKAEQYISNLTTRFKNPVWDFGPLTVNAALLPAYNAIIFPASMFLPPFYDPNAPEEVNMAAIGTVIGHELGHAVDDKGYTFDHKGRLKPWIQKADEKKFFARVQPLVDQFDKIGHNGKFTLGENIGDLVGLTNAYEVAFPAGTQKPQTLKKEFFLQYGKLWCEVQKPEIAELRLKVDPHALGFARANEQVKHQPGFAEAFNCKAGDPLVLPKEKLIRVW